VGVDLEEVARVQVRVPLLVAGGDARRVDVDLDGRRLRRLADRDPAGEVREPATNSSVVCAGSISYVPSGGIETPSCVRPLVCSLSAASAISCLLSSPRPVRERS
jgi:hypothetical protein